ncbi:ATP-dependent helicase HrpB [Marinobacter orientalis]|uniref:ATP-dependent helicase HrpB n=1 Tax=Marinobacter orientalis TaxID=1928859 RepID=A0A7Y0NKZ2_9GAMM|nr:ATP-dependent helicase HrpB [Marinobacter orientalis]NMT62832.1 ATP-dependent helicase HrpB [Marinobacter orientalis]TGX51509.1 ATP-dependent helicase HrpB [Marinobacter orientalis]
MLPINQIIPDLLKTLESETTVLLQAPPGAGKTTRVPLALLDAPWRQGRRILMLEPRRLAARSAARYMAGQMGEKPGQTVGYRTRLDTRVTAATVIEVVTEGILTRLIQNDPALEDYAAVIFDEFHERSLQADLGLALVRESRQALREDLRVIVMSATLDTAPIARLLGDVPVLTSEGRTFPVEVVYRPMPRNGRVVDQVVSVISEALAQQTGSLLVFLPGAGEIRRAERLLRQSGDRMGSHVIVAPLYGSLKSDEQDRAISPAPEGYRKVVLATAIAESSLTIEGIRVVIDSGQQRRAVFDANSGMTRLATGRVSRASAEQRKGRAGRIEPGVCYRLWSEAAQFGLADFTPPEIQQADLAPLVLELAKWGARSPDQLDWIDPPPAAHWQQAVELLRWLDMLDSDGAITGHGSAARDMGVHPRLAHMILRGREIGHDYLAAELAALLEERDLAGRSAGADMQERVRILRGQGPRHGVDAARVQAIGKAVSRLTGSLQRPRNLPTDDEVGRLLALAYPDRVARKRRGDAPRYQLSNGRGAALRDDDPLARHQWLATAELDGGAREATIYLAASVDPALLEQDLASHIDERDEALWDDTRGTVVARRVKRLGQLVLEETALPAPSAELMQQGLLAAVRKKGLKSLPWTAAAEQWLARVGLLAHCFPDDWPDITERWLADNLETWLGPFLAGMSRWRDLEKLNLNQALASLLDYQQQKTLDELAPTRLTIPTGQTVTLDYTAENGPVLAAKLQALFGWTQTPTVAGDRVPVVIHLLSPAQRPLAVTADLASFWRNAYPEVRKDMRGRYPRHPWPEDPLTAQASQGTKKRPAR